MRIHKVVQAVRQTLERTHGFAQGSSLVIGCSGGPDSKALTVALQCLATPLRLNLHVVYVDHGLRPESTQEGISLVAWAQERGLSAEVVRVHVLPQASVQAAAREARYEALVQAAERHRATWIAVGHTQDDHTETVLMRWLEHTTLRTLTGIATTRSLSPTVQLIRPLRYTTRAHVLDFLRTHHIPYVDDPSNRNPRYLRSRVRHEVVPLLRQLAPQLDEHLERATQALREDADCLDAWATSVFEQVSSQKNTSASGRVYKYRTEAREKATRSARHRRGVMLEHGDETEQHDPMSISFSTTEGTCRHALDVSVPLQGLRKVPIAIGVRVLARLSPVPLGATLLRALWHLCQSSNGSQHLDIPRGWRAIRTYDTLHFQPAAATPAPLLPLHLTQTGVYPWGAWTFVLTEWDGTPATANSLLVENLPLVVRSPQAGDCLRLQAGHRKVSDVLVDAKVPRQQRASVPVVACGKNVLWLVGHRKETPHATELHIPRWLLTAMPSASPG